MSSWLPREGRRGGFVSAFAHVPEQSEVARSGEAQRGPGTWQVSCHCLSVGSCRLAPGGQLERRGLTLNGTSLGVGHENIPVASVSQPFAVCVERVGGHYWQRGTCAHGGWPPVWTAAFLRRRQKTQVVTTCGQPAVWTLGCAVGHPVLLVGREHACHVKWHKINKNHKKILRIGSAMPGVRPPWDRMRPCILWP